MKPHRSELLGLVVACAAAAYSTMAAGVTNSVKQKEGSTLAISYEVALIDKSMTGDWRNEREFQKHVRELFEVSKILKFKLRGEPLQDWLDKESPSVAKVICLIDGWTAPTMKRVDVRGSRNGKSLKRTFEVEKGNWKEALARAKQYAESSP